VGVRFLDGSHDPGLSEPPAGHFTVINGWVARHSPARHTIRTDLTVVPAAVRIDRLGPPEFSLAPPRSPSNPLGWIWGSAGTRTSILDSADAGSPAVQQDED